MGRGANIGSAETEGGAEHYMITITIVCQTVVFNGLRSFA
jgi:hypothetical protein